MTEHGILQNWIKTAKAGRPVWLGDVKAACSEMQAAESLLLRLRAPDGSCEDFPCFLPPWEGEWERSFVLDLLSAQVFNLLAARSGRELCVYSRTENQALSELIAEMERRFLGDDPRFEGYRKTIRLADRLNAAAEGIPFAFRTEDLRRFEPLPKIKGRETAGCLAGRLREAAVRADRGFCCGLDVGGSDVKAAVSLDGRLLWTGEYDWNPASSSDAEGIIDPLLGILEEALARCGGGRLFDAIGVSFPDVVIRNRILGGETPKTAGMRNSHPHDYEREFGKLSRLNESLLGCCRPGSAVRIANDGNMAAFSSALELVCSGKEDMVEHGILAHSLGTDLGTGWLLPDGSIPEMPLEMYDFLLDLGSFPQRAYGPNDLRSVRNENSGLPGARRYLGQSACYRLAAELDGSMLDGYTEQTGETLRIASEPDDMRKPCLEHLMSLAEEGKPEAEEIFRRIGVHLAQVNREMADILRPAADERYLFGRMVKRRSCFRLIEEGCASVFPQLRLIPADENLAASPLMRQLAARRDVTVAQFGQSVGAIYYAMMEEKP